MEELSIFISIVLLVFGILQIILFFKIWGMTNDVKAMRNQVDVSTAYYLEEANEYLKIECDREAKACFCLALHYLKQGKIGIMPDEVLSKYQKGDDISSFLEKYITEKLK